MTDDVLQVFDQQREAFDRLTKKIDTLPSETLREAQKANAELLAL